jgi:3-phenylpropionate/trans-cinnamate dioxygenase ferredoxin reductase subunit
VAAQSVLAALAESGPPTAAYDAVPYFWSEMFGHMLQWTGYQPDPLAARMLLRGDPATQESWSVCWLDDDARLTAVLACNRPRDAVAARKLQAADPAGAPRMDLDALADPDRALAKAVASSPGTEV